MYEDHGYTQKEFADFLSISTVQLHRYEKDPDQPIRSDLLIVMAKRFHVSVDYLLGLTPVTKNTHEMEHLHLTTTACEKLICGDINGDTLSHVMEHAQFGELIEHTAAYFDDSKVEAINIQNEMAQFSASLMRRHAHETKNPENVHAAADGLAGGTVDAQKVQLEDLAALSETILIDSKKKIELEKSDPTLTTDRQPASAVSVARIAEIVEDARSQSHLSREEQIDYSADKILDEISAETGLKGTASKVLKPVFRFLFRKVGNEKDNQ